MKSLIEEAKGSLTRIETPIFKHEFVQFCFHPLKQDFLVTLSKNSFPKELKYQTLTAITAEDLTSQGKLKLKQTDTQTYTQKPRLIENIQKGIKAKILKDLEAGLGGLGGLAAILKKEKLKKQEQQKHSQLFQELSMPSEETENEQSGAKSPQIKTNKDSCALVKEEEYKLSNLNEESLQYQLSLEIWDTKQKFPTRVAERKLLAQESQDFTFSRDGSKIVILYYKKVMDRTLIVDGENSNESLQFQSESEDEGLERWVTVLDSEDMQLLFEGPYGDLSHSFDKVQLIWGGNQFYSYDNNQDSEELRHCFFDVNYNVLKQRIDQVSFILQIDDPVINRPGSQNLIFDEVQRDKIFTLVSFEEQQQNQREDTKNKAVLFQYEFGFKGVQRGREIQSFNIGSLYRINAFPNKSFSRLFIQDQEQRVQALILNLNTGLVQQIQNLGIDLELRPNQFLFEEFLGTSRDQDQVRHIVDIEQQTMIPSEIKGVKQHFDLKQSFPSGSFTEIADQMKDNDNLILSFYNEKTGNYWTNIRSISEMHMAMPFVVFCQGTSNIVIRNLHYKTEIVTLDLKDDYFVCFTSMQKEILEDHLQKEEVIKAQKEERERYEEEKFGERRDQNKNRFAKGIERTKEQQCITVTYLTVSGDGYKVNMLKIYPYCSRKYFVVEKYKLNQEQKFNFLPKKEIIQSHMIAVSQVTRKDFQKGVQSLTHSSIIDASQRRERVMYALVVQFKDMIAVRGLNTDYSFQTQKSMQPLKYCLFEDGRDSEIFWVAKDTNGYKIQILSFKEGPTNPIETLVEDGSKILSMIIREKSLFYLDETLTLRHFYIHTEDNKRSQLISKMNLNCTTKARDDLLAHQTQLFDDFHSAEISRANVLHIRGDFFRFFIDPQEMSLCVQEEELYQQSSEVDEKRRNLLRGPLVQNFTESQAMAYVYEEQDQNKLVYRPCMDSEFNYLGKASCSFAALVDKKITGGKEKVLALIKGVFFLFKINGEIEQEVKVKDKDKNLEMEIMIEIVSSNTKFYIFEGVDKVYELLKNYQTNKLEFQPFTSFDLTVKDPEKEIKRQKALQRKGTFFQRTFNSQIFETNKPEDNQPSVRVMNKELTKISPLDNTDISNMKFRKPAHSRDPSSQSNSNQAFESSSERRDDKYVESVENEDEWHIPGSLQLSDKGDVWNLYFDRASQQVFMKADKKIFKNKCIPKVFNERVAKNNRTCIYLTLMDNYVVFCIVEPQPNIYFVELDTEKPTLVKKKKKPKRINIDFSDEWTVKKLIKLSASHRIQIHLYNKQSDITAFMTWDLLKNMESRLTEIQGEAMIAKGLNSPFNYASEGNIFHDLEFSFPMNFYGQNEKIEMIRHDYEVVISENQQFLVAKTETSLYASLTMNEIERRFLSKFQHFKDKLVRKPFPLSMIQMRTLDGDNVFHLLVNDFKALKKFHNNFMRYSETFEDEDDQTKLLELYLLIMTPNLKGQTPFDLAFAQSSQFIDFFLKLLAEVQEYQLSRFIFKDLERFIELMNMGLPSFESFLETCLYQTISMQEVQKRYWKHGNDEEAVDATSTSLLQRHFLREFIGRSPSDPEEEKALVERVGEGIKHEVDIQLKDKELECTYEKNLEKDKRIKEFGGHLRRCEVKIIEFDWIFAGKEGFLFIEELATTSNENVFEVESIKICVEYLWQFYYRKIFIAVFLPYVVYFVIFLVYSMNFYSGEVENLKKFRWNHVFATMCLIRGLIFIYLQLKMTFSSGKKYLYSSSFTWGVLDILTTVLVVWFCVNDVIGGPVETGRAIGSTVIFLQWLKFFYFMRIFAPTAAFIRMITEIVKDMSIFSLIYFLACLTFANAYFMLDGARTDLVEERVSGDTWAETVIYVYRMSLGDFGVSKYQDSDHTSALWFYFILSTVLLQVVLLNLLIAIMGDTFDKVQERKEQAKLKEISSLIYENWFWVDQEKVFEKTKYIIVTQIEQAEDKSSGSWEGKIAYLKQQMAKQISTVNETIKQSKEQQKDEANSLHKQLLHSISALQKQVKDLSTNHTVDMIKLKMQINDLKEGRRRR